MYGIEVLTTSEAFESVRSAMSAAGLRPEQAEVTQRASADVPLVDEDARKAMRLLEMLEDLDDVQNVYSNADFPDEWDQQTG